MTPAMERWQQWFREGYTIRPRLRVGRRGYLEWGPGLFNPEGAFVRNVRRDTVRKLLRLGLVGEDGREPGAGGDAGDGASVVLVNSDDRDLQHDSN